MAVCYSCMREVPDNERVCPHCSHAVPYIPSNSRDLKPGFELYNGRFIVGRALGHGGFGITYIAFDRRLRTVRTIKEYYPRDCERGPDGSIIIPPEKHEMAEKNRQNFLHEAQMMTIASDAHIDHVVSVIDQFNENNTSYILMEYLDGKTIDDYMRDVLHKPFPWKDAVRLVAETLGALHKLHQHHILHRDISCNNIFLLKNGSPCVIDFGSAELTEDALKRPGQIRHSQKPAYTPREQAENKPQGPYSDVYAMAVVLFKMIVGNVDRNLKGQALPSIKAVTGNKSIPVELDRILADASNPDPSQRIQTAEEFQKRLNKLIGVKKQGGMSTGGKVVLTVLAAAVLGIAAWLVLGQNGTTKFSAPTLAYQDTMDAKGNTLTVGNDSVVVINGTAEPGENMILRVSSPNGEVYITREFTADGGKWTQEIDPAELNTPVNESRRYVVSISYQDENGTPAEEDLTLEVDRRFRDITFGYEGTDENSRDVTKGELVTITGTAQDNQYIVITMSSGGQAVISDEREAVDGTWSWQLDTAQLEVPAGHTTPYDISVGYRDVTLNAGRTLRLSVRAPQEKLTIGFAGTTEKALLVTSAEEEIRVEGTATPNESITLTVGTKTFYLTAGESGSWLQTIQMAQLDLEFGILKTYEIQAAYSGAPDEPRSEILELTTNLKTEEIKISPTLTWGDGSKDRKDITSLEQELSFKGTADLGASLILRADGAKIGEMTADGEGNWNLRLKAEAFGVGAGQQKDFRLDVADAADESNNSQFIRVRFDIPKVLAPLTVSFDGTTEKEYKIRRDGEAHLSGKGEPNEGIRLSIDSETRNTSVAADGTWHADISGDRYAVGLGETITKTIQAAYLRDESIVSDTLALHIEYPQFVVPTIFFYGVDVSKQHEAQKLGPADSISVYGQAEAGQILEIYLDGAAWSKTVQISDNGSWADTLFVEQMTANNMLDRLQIKARYQTQQTVTTENTLIIEVDRYADPILVDQARLDDETTEISGLAEAGAVLSCTDESGNVLKETKVANDNTFRFTGLTLQGNSTITITETDIYGNQAVITLPVYATERMLIEPEKTYSSMYSTLYGKDTRPETISGTAHAGKALTVTWNVNGGAAWNKTAQVDENGSWSINADLPETDAAVTEITFAYEDGKGIPVTLKFIADYRAEAIGLSYTEVPQTTTSLNLSVERSGAARVNGGEWVADADGDGRVDVPLPNLEGVSQLTIEGRDPYGNISEPVTISVKSLRTNVTGWIERLEDGTTFMLDDTIGIFGYVVAGEDAQVDVAKLEIFEAGTENSVYSLRGEALDEAQLQSLADVGEAAGAQLDMGWKISVKDLDKSRLTAGSSYEVRLIANVSGENRVLQKASFTYGLDQDDASTLIVWNDMEGWRCGLDQIQSSYHPNSIWFTGYYYADKTLGGVNTATIYLYSDQGCQELVTSKPFGLNKGKTLLSRTKDTDIIQGLISFDGDYEIKTETSGFILLFQLDAKQLPDGVYYAKLEISADQTFEFGPLVIHVNSATDRVKLKDITNNVTTDWAP